MCTDQDISGTDFWIEQWHIQNSATAACNGYGSGATWNAIADTYGKHPHSDDKEDRVAETLRSLEERGVKISGSRVLDVGCGPGRYAEAFARKGASVVCVDIAEKMIERLRREVDSTVAGRITPVIADWKEVALESSGFANSFDLVFANMTPAVSGPEAFIKLSEASKQWCWFRGWAGSRENQLIEQLHHEVRGKPPHPFTGNFYYAWNLAYSLGYFPDCVFEPIRWTHKKSLAECIEFYKIFFGVGRDLSAGEGKKIETCLSGLAIDGQVENTVKGHTGGMLWSIIKN